MRHALLLLATSAFALACETPPPPEPPKPPAVAAAPFDKGAELAPKVTVKLSGPPIAGAPELINGEVATLDTNKQVILIPITVTNSSDKEIKYFSLVNANGSINESIAIRLLGTESLELTSDTKYTSVKRVTFVDPKNGAFFLPNQITDAEKVIPPGGSINDFIVFDIPENIAAIKRFILTIPSNIVSPGQATKGQIVALDLNFGAEKFAPIERKVFPQKEWATKGPLKMRVTNLTAGPVLLVARSAKEGEPDYENPKHRTNYDLLKVEFEVENTSDHPLKYRPIHGKEQVVGLTLEAIAADESRETLGFAGIRDQNLVPKGQINSRSEDIAPGKTLKDFFLFDLPPDDIRKLEFAASIHLFSDLDPSARGLLRFQLNYAPPAPAPAPTPPTPPPGGETPPPTEPPK